MELQGIDVSRHQGTINWPKVKAAGKKFAFIRVGWAGWAGELSEDPNYKTNMAGAIAAGLDVGVYVYSYCRTPQAAKLAAQATLKLVKPYQLAYPIAFDIEDTSDEGTRYDKMPKAENTAIISAFLNEIQAAGYYGMIYTYKYFADANLDMSKLTAYDLWIAHYATKCAYNGKYGIWQYAGNEKGFVGTCDGIVGAVDLNVSYKDYAAIIKAAGLNGWAKQSVVPPTLQAPTETVNGAVDEITKLRKLNAFLEKELSDQSETIESYSGLLHQANQKLKQIYEISKT